MIAAGNTRVVLLVGPWAIKFPRVDRGGRQFVLGLLANLQEREMSLAAAGDRRLARTYFAAPLGLIAVAERIRGPLVRRRLERAELFDLPLQEFTGESGVDNNGTNVACRLDDGSLVVLDYGNPGLMYVAEGPRLVLGQPRVVVRCTPAEARWCPVCGDCKCVGGGVDDDLCDPRCPLHNIDSVHGDDADDGA